MKVVFRADASLEIGTGHVMRCLTLADALAARGADCQFICRAHEGNLIEVFHGKGYVVHILPVVPAAGSASTALDPSMCGRLDHSLWLGATQAQDAEACSHILNEQKPDWLIVDHYALDARWERVLAPHYNKLMVIDDLADRPHACDLLLDQTFGREAADYLALVPNACRLLCGSQFALLRPEFAALRPYSLQRRARPALRELLISMGGVDKGNATGQVLQALRTCRLPSESRITVVLGMATPWRDEVRRQAQDMPWSTRVLTGVDDMAQLMADSDLALGAAGGSTWERCCLGLPTIMLTLAHNQLKVAQELESSGGVKLVNPVEDLASQMREQLHLLVADTSRLQNMSKCAAIIVDGAGTDAVLKAMETRLE